MDMNSLIDLIMSSEDVLMDTMLAYATDLGYAKYTSPDKEAWRLSINGLSEALVKVANSTDLLPEMAPDDDFTQKEIARFGILEAQKHRNRGVPLTMFLSFMKYYNRAYTTLIKESILPDEQKAWYSDYVSRYFDYIELGFIAEWTQISNDALILDLQTKNRDLTNEKNKYVSIFDSIYDPVILFDSQTRIESVNSKAADILFGATLPNEKYSSKLDTDKYLKWLSDEIRAFVDTQGIELQQEKTVVTRAGEKIFETKYKKMLDVSKRNEGTVVIFNDITERIENERALHEQQLELETYAYTDPMTGVSNRRTGYMMLEKELSLLSRRESPLALCFLDVDNLKQVNDTYGHIEGDVLLTNVTHSITEIVREVDHIVRMGGDEFLIVLPMCDEAGAEKIVSRIIEKLNALDSRGLKPYTHSFSYGILEITADANIDVNEAIKLADDKMYEDKRAKAGNQSISADQGNA